MYERVTELDNTFNFWTFDPLSKGDIPNFVLESDKLFKIHIKYPTDDSKEDSDGENEDRDSFDGDIDDDSFDGNSDEDELKLQKIEEWKEFMKKHSERVVSIAMSFYDYSEDFFWELLYEIRMSDQTWTNLKSLKICRKIKGMYF